MRVALGLAVAAIALAGGCRQSDEQVRAELRGQFLDRCNADIAPRATSLPGFDANAYCGCVTDKALANRSVAELKAMFDDKAGAAEAGRQAARECISQQMRGGIPQQAVAPGPEGESAAEPTRIAESNAAEPARPAGTGARGTRREVSPGAASAPSETARAPAGEAGDEAAETDLEDIGEE